MSGNTLEFFVKMKDLMSGGLVKLAQNAQQAFRKVEAYENSAFARMKQSATGYLNHIKSGFEKLKSGVGGALGKAGGILGLIGISTGVFAGAEFAKASIEASHHLHMAEAALQNTMQNKGASHFDFLAAVEGADRLSKHMLYTKENVIDLESQLRLVGNISESQMQRMAKDSADMATKFHMGLDEAGNALAKAVNNPEMLRRLGMQLKISPLVQEHLQDLASKGKEAQARLELLTIVEKQVGGAAEAAFNTDPLAQYGKALEELKVSAGDALMPLVTSLADSATKTLEWMNISKTAPQVLMNEQSEINTLVRDITSLNEGNQMRTELLDMLVKKYPDLFAGIDTETVKNAQLLATLNKINDAYNTRIDLASGELLSDTNKKIVSDERSEWIRNQAIANAFARGDVPAAHALQTWSENSFTDPLRSAAKIKEYQRRADMHKGNMEAAQKEVEQGEKEAGVAGLKLAQENILKTFGGAYALAHDKRALKQTFGNNKNALNNFMAVAGKLNFSNGVWSTGGGSVNSVANRLTDLMTPVSLPTKKTGDDVARSAASGGPRTININGVKFADKIEIHGESMQDAYGKTETKMQEMYLRILNSGASVQSN